MSPLSNLLPENIHSNEVGLDPTMILVANVCRERFHILELRFRLFPLASATS